MSASDRARLSASLASTFQVATGGLQALKPQTAPVSTCWHPSVSVLHSWPASCSCGLAYSGGGRDGDKQVRFVAYTKMRQDQLRAAKKGGGAKRGQAQDDYSTSAKFVTAGGGDKLTDWQKQREREVRARAWPIATTCSLYSVLYAHSPWFSLHRSLTR
jgi:hypothetical protein